MFTLGYVQKDMLPEPIDKKTRCGMTLVCDEKHTYTFSMHGMGSVPGACQCLCNISKKQTLNEFEF